MSTNPYIQWLEGQIDPPVLTDVESWKEACSLLIRRMRNQQRLLSEGGNWDTFFEWLRLDKHFESVCDWALFTAVRTPEVGKDEAEKVEKRLKAARHCHYQGCGRSNAVNTLRGWLRRRNAPLSPTQRQHVKKIIQEWKAAITGEQLPAKQIAALHFRREKRYSTLCQENGVWLTREQAMELPPVPRALARQNAREKGGAGWYITADSSLAFEALSYLSDRSIRETLWTMQQTIRENDDTLGQMLAARQKKAKGSSFSKWAFEKHVIKSPQRIVRMMEETLSSMVPAYKRFDRYLHQMADKAGLDTVQPWDRPFLLKKLQGKAGATLDEPQGVFPVGKTLSKAMPELFEIGGWKIVSTRIHGRGCNRKWQYRLEREDGRTAQLWLAPFSVSKQEDACVGGYMQMVKAPWNGEEGVVVIELSLPMNGNEFRQGDLILLAHEVGHAIHYLGMAHQRFGESSGFADDMDEFPSQLLEKYANDPIVLARWASENGPEEARTAAFWRRYFSVGGWDIDYCMDSYLAYLADVTYHNAPLGHIPSFRQIVDELAERFNIPNGEMDKRFYSFFRWDDYASKDYCYHLGNMLVNTLVEYDGICINGRNLKDTYREVLDQVLSKSHDHASFARNWKAWSGKSVEESAREGLRMEVDEFRGQVACLKPKKRKSRS